MPEWLPSLTWPDACVFAMTIFLCLAASRVGAAGDFVGRLLGRKGKGGHDVAEEPRDAP